MPYYNKKKARNVATNSATSNRTSTVRRSRQQPSARSSGQARSAYRPARSQRTVRPSGSTSIPFMTRLRQLEETNRMASINSAEQAPPTSDTRSTTVTSQSPSSIPKEQTQTQPSAQPSFLVPHQPSHSQVQPSTGLMRHPSQPNAF